MYSGLLPCPFGYNVANCVMKIGKCTVDLAELSFEILKAEYILAVATVKGDVSGV